MGEFRFPTPKTDVFNEVIIGQAVPELRGQARANASLLELQRFLGSTVGPTYLLPGESIPLVSQRFAVIKETYTTANGIDKGVLYSRKSDTPLPVLGLVVCCHGQLGGDTNENRYLTVWDYLANCLAANGFLVASIRHFLPPSPDPPPDPPPKKLTGFELARDQFLTNVAFLLREKGGALNPAAKFNLSGKPLALMGASEGAAGAALAARRITEFALSDVVGYVAAVVSLAPSTSVALTSEYTQSLLVLQGTHDGDNPAGAGSLKAYEAAKVIGSKHFVWIQGANHIKFLLSGLDKFPQTDPDLATSVTINTQQLIAKNYVVRFLRWKMGNDTVGRSALIGDGSIQFENSTDPLVIGDFSKGLLRAFPRYDAHAKMEFDPASISFFGMFQDGKKEITAQAPAKYQPLNEFDANKHGPFSFQNTMGFWVEWDKKMKALPTVTIPCGGIEKNGFFEFQAVLADHISNPKDGLKLPTQLSLSENGKFSNLSKSVFVTIPPPLIMKTFFISDKLTRFVLSTIRIPISLFSVPNNKTIDSLRLNFFVSSAQSGKIALAGFRSM